MNCIKYYMDDFYSFFINNCYIMDLLTNESVKKPHYYTKNYNEISYRSFLILFNVEYIKLIFYFSNSDLIDKIKRINKNNSFYKIFEEASTEVYRFIVFTPYENITELKELILKLYCL